MSKIKVLQFTTSSNIGGTERNVLDLCQFIDKQKFDMGVASLLDDGPLLDYVTKLNVPVFRLKMSSPLDIGVLERVKKVFEEFKPDIVHIYGLRANTVGRWIAKKNPNIKIVCAIHGIDTWRKFYHIWLDRWTANEVDLFISNSEAGKKAFVEREHFPPDKIIVIHNGIDLSQYNYQKEPLSVREKYDWSDNSPVIGHIANLRPLKGHKIFLSILPELIKRFPKIKAVCLGYDYMNGELARIAKELKVSDYIEFLGYHPHVAEFIPAFDLCILPSDHEGLPMAILEAMAMAKPVVASEVGGISELIEDNVNGILIPPRNPQALLNAIIEIYSDPAKAKIMGLAGRKKAEEHFSIEKMVRQSQDAYIRILSHWYH